MARVSSRWFLIKMRLTVLGALAGRGAGAGAGAARRARAKLLTD